MKCRYYSTQRPVSFGTFPHKSGESVFNFSDKKHCEEIDKEAWGYVEYDAPLTPKEISDYELRSAFGISTLFQNVAQDCEKDGGTLHEAGCVKCGGKCSHRYCDKFKWVIDRAKAYEKSLGIPWETILYSWEKDRSYWYMNYYQDCNQPEITSKRVKVFDTVQDFISSAGKKEFRCPSCGGVSTDPYACNGGCDWKVYGLFGDMGKGVFVYIKEKVRGETIFMPLSWEEEFQNV